MQDPDKPRDDGAIKLPATTPGMNKIAPTAANDKIVLLGRGKEQEEKEKKNQEILARARKRLERCISAEADNRREGLDDDKFYAGDQWPADVRARRNSEKRPCLTINKLPVLIKQVTNDQRQNRPTIDVHPVGNRGDVVVAQIYRGLIRDIERQSRADRAYDTGFESAARKGWGYWRVTTEYETPDTFDQVIRVKRIRNAYSVYVDPDATEIDASDSNFGFITRMISREEFKEQWPNADQIAWTQGGYGDSLKDWQDQYSIRVAEYYEAIIEARELVMLGNGEEGWRDEFAPEVVDKLGIVQTRQSMHRRIMWYKITAKQILERTQWLGQWIPIVRVIGDEIDIEGRVKYWGMIRQAKDAQRQFNYWRTSETERVALAPKAPFIIAEGQLEGYEGVWKDANNKSHPFLPYRAMELHGHIVPPPQRQPPVEVPAGVVNAANSAQQDILTTTGVRFDATLNERTYDESGRALRELRRSGDIGSFNLVDNLMHGLRHTGEIMIDLIPKVYKKPGRVLTILRDDNTEEQVQVQPGAPRPISDTTDPMTQKVMRAFDPEYGHYGVTVTIGPSYATRRIETAESMMEFMRVLPNVAPLIADLVAKNQDWEGAPEIAKRLAMTLPPGMNQPEMRDVPPEAQALIMQLKNQLDQHQKQVMQLTAQVNDRNQDRALAHERINRTFQVQLLGIVQKAHQAQQKIASEDRHEDAKRVGDIVSEMMELYKEVARTDHQQGHVSHGSQES